MRSPTSGRPTSPAPTCSSAPNVSRCDIKTFTQELRLSAGIDDRLNCLLGAFYFNEKIEPGAAI